MNLALTNYDIYPRIIKENATSTITIRPLGSYLQFPNKNYRIRVQPLTMADELMSKPYSAIYDVTSDEDGYIRFTHYFNYEQEFYISLFDAIDNDINNCNFIAKLSIYSLAQDLYELRPYKGNMHCHSLGSDGRESPELVVSYYRKNGYDFLGLTDHRNYSSSVYAKDVYKDVPIDLNIIPSEEVHTPDNRVHIVSFGGNAGITEIYKNDKEKYYNEVNVILKTLEDVDDRINKFAFASCIWAANKIKLAGGLSIFAHPHWCPDVYHIPDIFTIEILKKDVFDALELLGGTLLPANQRHIRLHNELSAQGYKIPVVGSDDAHTCIIKQNNVGKTFANTYTIAFAKSNSKDDIFESIKDMNVVCIEAYDGEQYRVHGSYRLASYGRFLMENYLDEHNELCFDEGIQMKNYALGKSKSKQHLKLLSGRCASFLEHCFGND